MEYNNTGTIDFYPHCSQCHTELPIEEISVEPIKMSCSITRYPIDPPHEYKVGYYIKPTKCPKCGTYFDGVTINLGWYHDDVKLQYQDAIDFIKYLDTNYSKSLHEDENFERFRKIYDKENTKICQE